MKKTIVFCWLAFFALPLLAQVYTWTDNTGVVHFSDLPHPNARIIKQPQVQTYTHSPKVISPQAASLTTLNEPIVMTFLKPQNKATIRNNKGEVDLVVHLSRSLKSEERLRVLLDNQPFKITTTNTSFKLRNVVRGEHQIIIQIVNSNQRVIDSTPIIVFYMHRPRVKF